MKMSPSGRRTLVLREGFRLSAYRDSVGVWTVGVGHTGSDVHPGMKITAADVDRILTQDLMRFEQAVSGAVHVPMAQNEFDALVSFAFNIGVDGFKRSTVVRRLNEGNHRAAADAMLLWNKPPEIEGRRKAERTQFLAGSVPAPPPPDIEPTPPAPAPLPWWQRLLAWASQKGREL